MRARMRLKTGIDAPFPAAKRRLCEPRSCVDRSGLKFRSLRSKGFQVFKGVMGTFRRMVRALFGAASTKPEDIVFEPIDGPEARSQHSAMQQAVAEPLSAVSTSRSTADRAAMHKVSLGDLMERIPPAWKRATEWVPEEVIELPAAARFHAGAERPLAFSLRRLVGLRPELFRDPGARYKDVGVDLAMEPLRETEGRLTEIPAEVVSEVEEEAATFAQWELEEQSKRARDKEERETVKALRNVSLPKVQGAGETRFEVLLNEDPLDSGTAMSASIVEASGQVPVPSNNRLKRILEAYADGLTSNPKPKVDPSASAHLSVVEKATGGIVRGPAGSSKEASLGEPEWSVSVPGAGPFIRSTVHKSAPQTLVEDVASSVGTQQMRFDELGLSLSRFPEVKGFALWVGEQALQTGELGFDTQNIQARFRVEKILESALLTQGVQDGFLSVTVHHARGGISVFGGGSCLVAVAHQSEGMPSHLRSWLCGWVSQPLRS